MLIIFHFIRYKKTVEVYGYFKNHEYNIQLPESVSNRKYIFDQQFVWPIPYLSISGTSVVWLHVDIHEYHSLILHQDRKQNLDFYLVRLEDVNAIPTHHNLYQRKPKCLAYNNIDFIPFTNINLEGEEWRPTLLVARFPHWFSSEKSIMEWEEGYNWKEIKNIEWY